MTARALHRGARFRCPRALHNSLKAQIRNRRSRRFGQIKAVQEVQEMLEILERAVNTR